MPLYRRLPKRGFSKWRRKDYNELSLGTLQAAIDAGKLDKGQAIDLAALVAGGVVRRPKDGLRLLGGGELTTAVNITVNHASASAKVAVEAAGGSVSVIEVKVLEADVAKAEKSAAKKKAKA